MKRLQFPILIMVLIIGVLSILYYKNKNNTPIKQLPYFAPPEFADKSKYTLPNFSFVNQYGLVTDSRTVRNKIYVADFFFVTCTSICPIMANQMQRVYHQFQNDTNILIISHTVNPEEDSVHILKKYAEDHGIYDKKWLFVTGNKKHLYEVARKGYMLNVEPGNGSTEDFIHTQQFVLIDRTGHIRGYYDGTDSIEVNRLIIDIKVLESEK